MAENNRDRQGHRLTPAGRLEWLLAMGLALGAVQGTAAEFAFDGGQFNPVGVLPGDQGASALALSATGGLLVWQDNSTDGDGLGISGRRLTAAGSPAGSVFRVNGEAAGDQENPAVASLPDGGAVVVWQGGDLGAKSIYARVIGPDGVFRSGDVLLSAGTDNCQDPAVATLSDGRVVVVWTSDGADGSMDGLFARRIEADGTPVMELIRVNQFTQYNQRSASVVGTSNGGFLVTWVSEQQSGPLKADVYARAFSGLGTSTGSEFRVNPSSAVCGTPTVAVGPDGNNWFLWAERIGAVGELGSWEVNLRRYDAQLRALGNPVRVNSSTEGNQFSPKISTSGGQAMVIWSDDTKDGSGLGVAGVIVGPDGTPSGTEWLLNTTKLRDQSEAVIASGGFQNWVTVWTDWTGYREGTDLFAQRVGPASAPLEGITSVFGDAISAWQVSFSWLAPEGVAIAGFDLSFDGGAAIEVAENYWASTDVLPGTQHTARIRYRHQDGRVSPWSAPATATTWGKDQNGDGLPDDWQQQHFGANATLWPGPGADSDGDGVSNRNEFLAGTNPVDASDVLRVTVVPGAQGIRLDWNTRPGAFYQLQSSGDLSNWTSTGIPRLAPGTTDGVVIPGDTASAYYRIKRVR